jgi:sugar lactone lactonase YvrE
VPEPEPEPTQPLSAISEIMAEHPGPTRVTEVEEEPTAASPPSPTPSSAKRSGGPRWGRIGLALGVVAAIVVAGLVVFEGGGGGGEGANGFAPSEVAEKHPAPGFPVGVATGNGKVAVATRAGQRVGFVNENTGEPITAVNLGNDGEDVVIAAEAAWVTVPNASQVIRVPLDGSSPKPIHVGSAPYGITFDGDSIWVAQPDSQAITGIDPATDQVSTPIPIEGSQEPSEIASGDGRLWVVDRGGDRVISVDPGDPSVQEGQNVGDNPKGVVVDDGSVWVANTDGGNVDHFTTAGEELDPVTVDGHPRLMAAGFGRIWVANENGYVSAIDTATDVVERIDVPGSPEGVAVGSDRVWVTTGSGNQLITIKPGDPTG